jgi:hypothetical protein
MFTLNNETVRLANINTRTEKHGEDDVLACDIKLEFKTANAVLSKFSESLKEVLYTKDEGAVEDLIHPDHAPKLRNPLMGPIRWNLEMPSVQFRIHHGETDADDIVFSGAKCNKFQFLCQEGGTVVTDFRIQVSEPDEEAVTKLLFMLNQAIKVSLFDEAPQVEDQQQDAGAEKPNNVVDLFDGSGAPAGDEAGTGGDGTTADEADDQPGDEPDPMYGQAVEFVRGCNKVSITTLQRGLRVGYNRAARLVEQLEAEGVISAADSSGKREVLVTA